MTDDERPAGVTPPVAVVLAAVTFLAVSIGGLGVMSLVLDADVILVRGLGVIPGVIGEALALLVFSAALWWGLRDPVPGLLTAVPCALGAYVGEVIGIVLGALITGDDMARGVAAAGSVALRFPGAVVAIAGMLAALFGVALVRARSPRPRWGWEDDEG